MAELPGPIGAVVGNETLQQIAIWGILQQILGAALAPAVQALQNTANGAAQEVPLSPADLALAVIRNVMGEEAAAKMAALSGISPENFKTLTLLTGDAIAPQEAAVALRRKIIDAAQYDTAIRQGRLRDEYAPVVKALAVQQPSPVEALQAYLTGQTDQATSQRLYEEWGADPQYWQLMFDTRGSSPSPVEAGRMAYRGIIPWTGRGPNVVSFEQAFWEGPWRNKWSTPMEKLAEYWPPPRTIVAMYREGGYTADEALAKLKGAGLSDADAQAYLKSASHTSTTAVRELSVAIVHALYTDQLISPAVAKTELTNDRYTGPEADYILQVWDNEVQARIYTAAVRKIGTLYVGHKLDKTMALAELSTLGVPSAQGQKLLTIWAVEREANVRVLTEAQIVDAWKIGVLDVAATLTELQSIGYSQHDAAVLIAIKNGGIAQMAVPSGATATETQAIQQANTTAQQIAAALGTSATAPAGGG